MPISQSLIGWGATARLSKKCESIDLLINPISSSPQLPDRLRLTPEHPSQIPSPLPALQSQLYLLLLPDRKSGRLALRQPPRQPAFLPDQGQQCRLVGADRVEHDCAFALVILLRSGGHQVFCDDLGQDFEPDADAFALMNPDQAAAAVIEQASVRVGEAIGQMVLVLKPVSATGIEKYY